MAGLLPTFLTGANAKIKLNGKTLAYCTDFSCSIDIIHKTPKVLGKYEGDSVEPLGYMVSGSFSVVRYVKSIKEKLGADHVPSIAGNDSGNGVGNWGTVWGGGTGFLDALARVGGGIDGRAHEALDPSKFSQGTTFDIQIYQKVSNTQSGTSTAQHFASLLPLGLGDTDSNELLGVMNIRNARITKADFGLQKRGVAIEHFNFVALYVDGDAYVANSSK